MGWIKRGGGDGGEPVRSPPGWLEFSPAEQVLGKAGYLHRLTGALTFGWMLDAS